MNEKDIKTKSDKDDSEDFQFNIDYHKEEDEDLEYKEYTCIFVPYDTKEVEMNDVKF